MQKKRKYTIAILLALIISLFCLVGCSDSGGNEDNSNNGRAADLPPGIEIVEDGTYDSKEEVAAYIYVYDKLPSNYITKAEARDLGWSGGSVEKVAKGKCIGGDLFGNYEEQLPEKSGRVYHECDIDTLGYKDRGSRRIIYSDDKLIYYTGDHYRNFTKLYDADGPVD